MIHIVPIKDIKIGERRREDMGDLAGLAESIEKYGLLHAIVIDGEGRLVAGERRLAACRDVLGLEHIECKNLGELTDEEREEIELEENLRRKDLTPYERAKTTADLAQAAKKAALTRFKCLACDERFPVEVWHCPKCDHHWQMHVEECRNCHEEDRPPISEQVVPKSAGRPPEPGSDRDVELRTGISRPEIRRAEQHVETAEQFAFMQGPEWKQSHVLEAGKHLSQVKDERAKEVATKMIQEPFIPPATAVRMLKTLAEMPDEERQRVADLYESEHPQDQSLAKTRLMQRDPMPDPRGTVLGRMVKDIRELVHAFPNDPLTPAVSALIDPMKAVVDQINQQQKERINDSGTTDASRNQTVPGGPDVR